MIESYMTDKEKFQKKGYFLYPNFFDRDEITIFRSCAESIQNSPETPGGVMKYFELSNNKELLNRAEFFIGEYPDLKRIALGAKIKTLIQNLTGKDYILFKEKINYKLPGGEGFRIHQDAPAFTRFSKEELIVLMVPVDNVNEANGCLQVANNLFKKTIIPHTNGTVEDKLLNTIKWENILLQEGDLLIFSSYLLHKSDDNKSQAPRRCYYLTYNLEKLGDMRNEYFNYKRANFPPRIERKADIDYDSWKSKLSKSLI